VISAAEYGLFRSSLAADAEETAARIDKVQEQLTGCRARMNNTDGQILRTEELHFDKLDRVTADEFIDCIEIGAADESGEREIHIRWKM
jgi:hypothetical protein